EHSVGATLSKNPSVKDIGLPIYPASKPHKDEPDDSGANLGLWGGGSGFKLTVLKWRRLTRLIGLPRSTKRPWRKYGKVLDCTNGVESYSCNRIVNEEQQSIRYDGSSLTFVTKVSAWPRVFTTRVLTTPVH